MLSTQSIIGAIIVATHSTSAHEGHDGGTLNADGSYPDVVRSPAVVFHAVFMSLIVFAGIPYGLLQILRRKYFQHKVVQFVNAALIVVLGTYAAANFGDHTSTHSVCGLLICFLFIPIQVIIPLLKYVWFLPSAASLAMSEQPCLRSIHRNLGIMLSAFVFPSQWFLGIAHLVGEGGGNYATYALLGHYGPSIVLCIGGLFAIWKEHWTMRQIMKAETVVLISSGFIELVGEIATHAHMTKLNAHGWGHIVLDAVALLCGAMCILFAALDLEHRTWYHAVSVAMFLFSMGYAMLFHQHAGMDMAGHMVTARMHALHGQVMCIAAVVRVAMCYSKRLQPVLGGILIMAGTTFLFSYPLISSYWELNLKYPVNPAVILVLALGFYLVMINIVLKQVKEANMDSKYRKSTSGLSLSAI